jgi:hypothetical protein
MKAYEGVDIKSHGFFFRFFFFYHFPIRPCGLFPIRINLELCTLQRVGRTPWMRDQPCHKAAPYRGQRRETTMALTFSFIPSLKEALDEKARRKEATRKT